LSDLIWLLPIGVISVGAYSILVQLVIRLEQFDLLAGNKIIASASNHFSKYGLGLVSAVPFGLVIGQILGSLVPLLTFIRSKKVRDRISSIFKNKATLKPIAKRYKDFPLFNGAHTLYDSAYQTTIFSIISIGYGEVALGLFAFAFRYLRIPVQVIGVSLTQVLHPRISRMRNESKPIRGIVAKSLAFFILIGIIPFGLLFFFGEEMFAFVFGGEWTTAGRYAEIMAPWLLINFAISPLSILPTLVHRQKSFLMINIFFSVAIMVALIWLFERNYEFELIIYCLTFGNIALSIFLYFWFLNIADKNPRIVR
jgi:O-antigen/teichoic acid export membrane protein